MNDRIWHAIIIKTINVVIEFNRNIAFQICNVYKFDIIIIEYCNYYAVTTDWLFLIWINWINSAIFLIITSLVELNNMSNDSMNWVE